MAKYTKFEELPVWKEAARLYKPVQGKRHLAASEREKRDMADKARRFRENFLRDLKPNHPLHFSPEARAARGESVPE